MTKQLNEEHIRVAAYYLWQNAHCPEGMEKEFWYQACDQLLNMNKVCNKKALSKHVAAKVPAKKKAPAKKAAVKSVVSKPVVAKPLVSKPVVAKPVIAKPAIVAKPFYGSKK